MSIKHSTAPGDCAIDWMAPARKDGAPVKVGTFVRTPGRGYAMREEMKRRHRSHEMWEPLPPLNVKGKT